jgi:hypothetical protein
MMSASTFVAKTLRQNLVFRLYKYYIIDSIIIVKKFGFKELVRKRGVKFFYIIFGYYLVRDTLIYIVIPYCVARGLF